MMMTAERAKDTKSTETTIFRERGDRTESETLKRDTDHESAKEMAESTAKDPDGRTLSRQTRNKSAHTSPGAEEVASPDVITRMIGRVRKEGPTGLATIDHRL